MNTRERQKFLTEIAPATSGIRLMKIVIVWHDQSPIELSAEVRLLCGRQIMSVEIFFAFFGRLLIWFLLRNDGRMCDAQRSQL